MKWNKMKYWILKNKISCIFYFTEDYCKINVDGSVKTSVWCVYMQYKRFIIIILSEGIENDYEINMSVWQWLI